MSQALDKIFAHNKIIQKSTSHLSIKKLIKEANLWTLSLTVKFQGPDAYKFI